jgi:hypothetical protein
MHGPSLLLRLSSVRVKGTVSLVLHEQTHNAVVHIICTRVGEDFTTDVL